MTAEVTEFEIGKNLVNAGIRGDLTSIPATHEQL
ncbi:MAG: hypothetical protein ACI8TF_003031 [Paracoccaceae bacterium]|jgi:hypothetical protein